MGRLVSAVVLFYALEKLAVLLAVFLPALRKERPLGLR